MTDRVGAGRPTIMALVIVSLIATSCGHDATRPATSRLVWGPCQDRALSEGECATLHVPVDYGEPSGATTRVAVFRFRARAMRQGILVVNPGGPGASGIDYVSGRGRDGFPGAFDVIGFDPRGFGRSDAVRCLSGDDHDTTRDVGTTPGNGDDIDRALRRAANLAERCAAERLGPHLGSVNVARDIDEIRRATGEDTITYVGFSYGGLLGWTYARLFPNHVRAMVLDAPEDPSADLRQSLLEQARTLEALIRQFSDACAANAGWGCPPHPATAIREVLTRSEAHPIPTGEGEPPLASDDALNAVISAFFDPATWPELAAALTTALDGHGAPLADLSYHWRQRTRDDEPIEARAPVDLVYCADHDERPSVADLDRFADEAATLVPTLTGFWPERFPRCHGYRSLDGPAPNPPSSTGFPVVVVGATDDPATPYQGAVHLADAMGGSARLLTRVGAGHTSYGRDRCIDGYVDRFLMTAELPTSGTRCDEMVDFGRVEEP